MYRILIVEDNQDELVALSEYVNRHIYNSQIDVASSYDQALDYVNSNIYSCIFLDICLDDNNSEKNGISLGYEIRKHNNLLHTPIVFITTVNNKLREALNHLHCFEYLSKPYSESDIKNCLSSLLQSPLCKQIKLSYRDVNGIVIKINPEDILYVSIKGHHAYIYGHNNSYEINRTSIEKINKQLGKAFIRCHRSYLVNSELVDHIDLTLRRISIGKHDIPIGRFYYNDVKEFFIL